MNIIFLDIDGVLNCSTTQEKVDGAYRGIGDEQIKVLFTIVRKTKARLVLISSWKEHWYRNPELKCKQDELANYLDKRMSENFMKISNKVSNKFLKRGRAIKDFLYKCKEKGLEINFIIIDDHTFDYKQENIIDRLIKPSYERGGLNDQLAKKAIKLLS